MQGKKLIVTVAAVAALLSCWYYGSPWWTLWQMREAAEARDGEKLARYVDFPALRESSKAQLKARLAAEAVRDRGRGDGLGALGAAVGAAMSGPLADALITPEALQAIFARAPKRQGADGWAKGDGRGSEPQKPFGADSSNAELIREGFDRFRLHRKGAAGEAGDLIFRRHGLGWKLEEIRIAGGSPASAAAG